MNSSDHPLYSREYSTGIWNILPYSLSSFLFAALAEPKIERPEAKNGLRAHTLAYFVGCLFSTCSQCQNQWFPHRKLRLSSQIRKVNLRNDRNIIIFQVGSQRLLLRTLYIPRNIPECRVFKHLLYSKRNSTKYLYVLPMPTNFS